MTHDATAHMARPAFASICLRVTMANTGTLATTGLLACEVAGIPVGFVLAIRKDGRAHILEVAFALAEQGRGHGRALMAAAEDWAAHKGFGEVTLTTFRDVSWNAPFYANLGYDVFEVGSDRPELSDLIAQEVKAGNHGAARVAMRKALQAK